METKLSLLFWRELEGWVDNGYFGDESVTRQERITDYGIRDMVEIYPNAS